MLKKVASAVLAGAVVFTVSPLCTFAAERYEVLMLGDEDGWVRQLQADLISRGYMDGEATGYFGSKTQEAVVKFQERRGLTVDGKAGPETRQELLGKYYEEIPETRDVSYNTISSSEAEADAEELLYPGDKGSAVEDVQSRLKKLGYYEYDEVTGYFGPITQEAVEKFQKNNEIGVDGIVGPETQGLLESGDAKYYTLEEGDKGEDVEKVQEKLKKLGYFDSNVTGYYGSITEKAVREFQERNGLTVDGKAGKNTRAKLFSSSAKKASTSSSSKKEESSKDDSKKEDSKKEDNKKEESSNVSSADSGKVSDFLNVAKDKLGSRYVFSTEGPNTFDCSGFVYYCLKNSGIKVGRMSAASYSKYSSWDKISSRGDLEAGDLMFFRSPGSSRISHVGIYLGGNQMIHASSSKGKVIISDMSSYWKENFVVGRRVF